MKKGGGSESTKIIGPSKSVLVYALDSLKYALGLVRFRVFVPNLLLIEKYYAANVATISKGSDKAGISYKLQRSTLYTIHEIQPINVNCIPFSV